MGNEELLKHIADAVFDCATNNPELRIHVSSPRTGCGFVFNRHVIDDHDHQPRSKEALYDWFINNRLSSIHFRTESYGTELASIYFEIDGIELQERCSSHAHGPLFVMPILKVWNSIMIKKGSEGLIDPQQRAYEITINFYKRDDAPLKAGDPFLSQIEGLKQHNVPFDSLKKALELKLDIITKQQELDDMQDSELKPYWPLNAFDRASEEELQTYDGTRQLLSEEFPVEALEFLNQMDQLKNNNAAVVLMTTALNQKWDILKQNKALSELLSTLSRTAQARTDEGPAAATAAQSFFSSGAEIPAPAPSSGGHRTAYSSLAVASSTLSFRV